MAAQCERDGGQATIRVLEAAVRSQCPQLDEVAPFECIGSERISGAVRPEDLIKFFKGARGNGPESDVWLTTRGA